jgi:flagellar basal-body rod protein FlgB
MFLDKLVFGDKTSMLLKKGLNVSADRQLLISANISNMDTPGFKASEINFSKEMEKAMGSGDLAMNATNSKHMAPDKDNGEFEVFEEPDASKSNGNNVNPDKEMAKLAENQIMYNAVAQIYTKRSSSLRAAVTDSVLQ